MEAFKRPLPAGRRRSSSTTSSCSPAASGRRRSSSTPSTRSTSSAQQIVLTSDQVAEGHPRARGAAAEPLRVGPDRRHPGAGRRDARRDPRAEGRASESHPLPVEVALFLGRARGVERRASSRASLTRLERARIAQRRPDHGRLRARGPADERSDRFDRSRPSTPSSPRSASDFALRPPTSARSVGASTSRSRGRSRCTSAGDFMNVVAAAHRRRSSVATTRPCSTPSRRPSGALKDDVRPPGDRGRRSSRTLRGPPNS